MSRAGRAHNRAPLRIGEAGWESFRAGCGRPLQWGAVQFVVGIIATLNGPFELMITYIFSPVAFLETIWLLVMGVLMGRRTMQAEG